MVRVDALSQAVREIYNTQQGHMYLWVGPLERIMMKQLWYNIPGNWKLLNVKAPSKQAFYAWNGRRSMNGIHLLIPRILDFEEVLKSICNTGVCGGHCSKCQNTIDSTSLGASEEWGAFIWHDFPRAEYTVYIVLEFQVALKTAFLLAKDWPGLFI